MDRILWSTTTIKVPREMVNISKTGRVTLINTLTKTNNISRRQKQQAVKLVPADNFQIIHGKSWNVDALKEQVSKANALAKKNRGKEFVLNKKKIFEGKVKKRASALVDERLGIDPTVKGYSWDNQKNNWKARIKINQRIRHLGYFDNENDAHEAYLKAKREQLRN